MPINPHELKPVELLRLMNATPLGDTMTRCRVYRQRERAGSDIGNGETIDLVRYAGWLFRAWWEERRDRVRESAPDDEAPAPASPAKPVNPLSLSLPEAAWLLSKAAGMPVTAVMVRAAVAAGCPVDADGRLNLVHLAAWINKESPDGD